MTAQPAVRGPFNDSGERIFTAGFTLVVLASVAFTFAGGLLSSTAALLVVEQLHLPAHFIGVSLGATALTALISRVPIGIGIDRYGSRRFGVAGPLFIGAGALMFSVTRSGQPAAPFLAEVPLLLVLASLSWGLGIGCFSTAANTYVANTVPAVRRAEAVGYFGISMTLGQGLGLGVGYSIVANLGFTVLYGTAVTAAVVACVLIGFLREVRPESGDALRPGFALETKVLAPTFGLFTLTIANGIALAAVPLLGAARGLSNPGLYFLAVAAASIVGRFAGRTSDRHGRMVVIVPGMLLAALGQALLSGASSVELVMLAGFAFGLGFAVAQSTMLAFAIDLAGAGRRGAAVATFSSAADLGILVGTNLGGLLLATLSFGGLFGIAAASPVLGTFILLLAVARTVRSGGGSAQVSSGSAR